MLMDKLSTVIPYFQPEEEDLPKDDHGNLLPTSWTQRQFEAEDDDEEDD
jgi:hypothetical protein